MKKEIFKGIVISLSFTVTTFLTLVVYASWTNILPKSNGQTINEIAWNELVNNINTIGLKVDTISIPTGAVMAFNGTICPTGWTLADGSGDEKDTSGANTTLDLRGEFIRGLDATRTLASKQAASKVMYAAGNPSPIYLEGGGGNYIISTNNGSSTVILTNANLENIASAPTHYATTSSWLAGFSSYATTSSTTSNYGSIRPNNTALLYCVKL